MLRGNLISFSKRGSSGDAEQIAGGVDEQAAEGGIKVLIECGLGAPGSEIGGDLELGTEVAGATVGGDAQEVAVRVLD